MGNIDVAHVLTYGTKEEVYDAVKVQNLRWMIKATQKFGKYPLNL